MIDFPKGQHAIDLPYCRIEFFKDHNWCNSDADWTHVQITSHKSRYSGAIFTREQSYLRDRVIGILGDAYEAGRENKAAQIRQVLGVPKL